MIGEPIDRIDGPLKLTGQATYAYEHRGVGELGNCGANAAVANAVFNATGVRVRDFPITVEKVLPGLPLPVAITSE